MGPRRVACSLLCLAFLHQTAGLRITVFVKECVSEEVNFDGDMVSGNFVVLDNGNNWGGIELVVTGPSGQKVVTTSSLAGEKFEFQAQQKGLYNFCFYNPSAAPEQVIFYIHVGHIPGIEDLAKDENLKPVSVRIAQLREALEGVSAEQQYLKARDLRQRFTNESTHKRLIAYTVGEYCCLVGVSMVKSTSFVGSSVSRLDTAKCRPQAVHPPKMYTGHGHQFCIEKPLCIAT